MPNPHLPPEILDHIVDFLHGCPSALRWCCLVSKSWVPRTRKHLFAEVDLCYKHDLECWKAMFPDPSASPAHFAKSLRVGCASDVAIADAEVGGWLTGFTHITHLEVESIETYCTEPAASLVAFHGFSSTVKSLCMACADHPPSQIFDFILSSPLLEDLTVTSYRVRVDDGDGSDNTPTFVRPSNTPVLNGTLKLSLDQGMKPIISRLLVIPGGIHFRKLTLTWLHGKDLPSIIALVGECSRTLESLDIVCISPGTSVQYLHSR